MRMRGSYMADEAIMSVRAMPTALAVPLGDLGHHERKCSLPRASEGDAICVGTFSRARNCVAARKVDMTIQLDIARTTRHE
jgi:hypothetical protein